MRDMQVNFTYFIEGIKKAKISALVSNSYPQSSSMHIIA